MDLDQHIARQHGAVSRGQLRAAGVAANTIDSRVRRGRLVRLLPSVYATTEPTLLTRAHAAALWVPGGLVSHLAAAHLWGLAVPEPDVVHLTVPRARCRRSPVDWLRTVRRDTPRRAVGRVGVLPVTSINRTIQDCMTVLDDSAAGVLIDQATATLTSERVLRACHDADRRLRGSPTLAGQLARLVPGAASAPERVLATALRATGLDGFLVNEPVEGGYVADLVDPVVRLIVEIDGYRYHRGRQAFQADRTRQNHLVLDGYLVLRFTAADVFERLGHTVVQISRAHAARSVRSPSRNAR